MLTKRKPLKNPAPDRTVREPVRVGRNFIRPGDPLKVKLPGKTTFRSGYTFVGLVGEHLAVKAPNSNERIVPIDAVKRVAVTRNGERKVVKGS